MNIGITGNGSILYGSTSNSVTLPVGTLVSSCKFVTNKHELDIGPDTSNPTQGYMFLEDFYDPKSRVRRGRIFSAWTSQPQCWRGPNVVYGNFNSYTRCSIWADYYNRGHKDLYVMLGDEKRFTTWKLIDLEVIATGEEMLTLKAISNFGLLPELLDKEIPADELPLILNKIAMVVDDMYTASSESVVDCCREAATAIISAYTGRSGKDLGTVYKDLAKIDPPRFLAKDAANIINLFHSRRKTAEIQQGRRRITDEDAQLAVQCLGTILVELEWGRW